MVSLRLPRACEDDSSRRDVVVSISALVVDVTFDDENKFIVGELSWSQGGARAVVDNAAVEILKCEPGHRSKSGCC
jgi:hypothetical protein